MTQELDMALVILMDFVSSPLVLTLAGLSLLLYAFWWALTAECFCCVRSSPPVEGEHLLPVTAKRSDSFPAEAPAGKAIAEKAAAEEAEKKAAAKGKAAAEAKAADDKLWIFTEEWFNLRFVLQSHKQSLYAFAAAGLIEIGARGCFRMLVLTVKNLASCPLKVLVPRGSWFHNRTPFHQPLVTIRDRWIEIEPGALATVDLDTFCGIRTYGCPLRDEMELSPYVFDGDDVMMSQVKVWDCLSRYVPAIPKKHQPSNPASSILPNPQLDEEAAKAVLKDMRDQEHKAAAAQAKALHAKAKAVNKEPRTRWEGTPHVGPWGQWYAPARRSSSTSLGCCCCLAC